VSDKSKERSKSTTYAQAVEKFNSDTQAQILETISRINSSLDTMASTGNSKDVQKELMKNVEVPTVPYHLFDILVQKCEKEGYHLEPAFVHNHLRKTGDYNLWYAFKAIAEEMEKRTKALEESGRITVAHESTFLSSWGAGPSQYYNTLLTYLEDEDKQLKEVGTLGWKSAVGLLLKSASKSTYKNPEYCRAGLYEYHVQLNASRNRRAMYYNQCRQQNISEGELEACLKEWDEQENNLLHIVPANETHAQRDARLTRLNRARTRILDPVTAEENQQIADMLVWYQSPCAQNSAMNPDDPFLTLISEVIKECDDENAKTDTKVSLTFSQHPSHLNNVQQFLGRSTLNAQWLLKHSAPGNPLKKYADSDFLG
jgi:hypothetical protein